MSAAESDDKGSGGGLPDIIGDATRVADTSVMKDLLGRSFKAAGDYFGEYWEDYFNKLREQRRKNIRDHQARVAGVIGEDVDILSNPSRHQALRRCVELAAHLPVEDADRSAISE